MKLVALEVEGFGKFSGEHFAFDPGLNVVFGENESGKSTLANAVVACLYGVGRKDDRDAWRPWSGARYAARLRYVLGDGREYEVQREFERDPRGVRVYDRNGKDVAGDVAVGKVAAPGAYHSGVPLEVFLNAACMHQQAMAIEDTSAKSIGTSLSRALDGGPREDAALGAIKRLDEALRKYVGTERATKNAPLRAAREQRDAAIAQADGARRQIAALDDLRTRLDRDRTERDALGRRHAEHERRGHALRIAHLRKKLENLRAVHDDVAALQAQRARFDDVAAFVPDRVGDLDEAYHEWREREALAAAAERDAASSHLRDDEHIELESVTAAGELDPQCLRKSPRHRRPRARAKNEPRPPPPRFPARDGRGRPTPCCRPGPRSPPCWHARRSGWRSRTGGSPPPVPSPACWRPARSSPGGPGPAWPGARASTGCRPKPTARRSTNAPPRSVWPSC